MQPTDLKPDDFAGYPPLAQKLALANLPLFRRLPLSFLPSLLLQLSDYDFRFPEERRSIDAELSVLSTLTVPRLDEWFAPFVQLKLSSKLEHANWVSQPAAFLEDESAWLWTTQQQDAFRAAATDYGSRLQKSVPPAPPLPLPRLGIAIIGQGVTSWDGPLFSNLRPYGTLFTEIEPQGAFSFLLGAVEARASAHPLPYGHWYVEGGVPADHSPQITCVSWDALSPVRVSLLNFMQKQIHQTGMGPELLRTDLARLLPADLGMSSQGDPVFDRFQLKVFTEGSGTQIFSTTFAQWTAREALRRAQPLTLLVRFAPRQRQRPMNELLSSTTAAPEPDPAGSLVDADMGAWYNWVNQQRLPGYQQSVFLAWFEGHRQALVVAPSLPRGTQSGTAMNMSKLLSLAMGD
jgi:hypothetical protein